MHDILPGSFFDLYNEASGVDAFAIAMLTINGLIGITAQPHSLSMNATGRTERAGRIGQTYGNFVKRLCTIGWALTGLIVAAMLAQHDAWLSDREQAFGYACRRLLGPGWTGLMVSCVLAANMSTCSNFMVNTGALFTRNVYKDYLRPQSSDRELLWMGRLSGLALTLSGVGFALIVEQVLQAFLFTETIAAFMGIMFAGGILWRRANRQGALAATVAAFGAYYALMFAQSGQLRLVYTWQAAPFGWAMLAGLIVLVLVSLVTPPEDPRRIAHFFDNMRRSSDATTIEGEPRPLAAARGQDLILLDLTGWVSAERWRGFLLRYREDLIGFVLAWVSVGALVVLAWGLMQIGK